MSVTKEVDVMVRRTDSDGEESGDVAAVFVTGVKEVYIVAAEYG